MKPYFEEKTDKVSFRITARTSECELYKETLDLISRIQNKTYKFNNNYKEKVRKNSVKLK